MARIAVYKTCWDSGCYDVDLLAAFDDAIRDGVDVLSLSLGPASPQGDYFNDAISIGSFHASSRGIVVVSSAGNEGNRGSATNLAPWMITVAASSMDRDFTSNIILGDGINFTVMLSQKEIPIKQCAKEKENMLLNLNCQKLATYEPQTLVGKSNEIYLYHDTIWSFILVCLAI